MSGDFEVSNNTAKLFGGGIFAGEHVEIKDGRIESNKSEAAYGGGLHIDGNLVTTHMEIRNISFIGNVSKCGEGGAISSGRSLSALNSLFADNRTDGNGGALYLGNVSNFDYRLKKSDITVSGGNIFDNSAKRGTVLYYAADMNFSFTDGAKYSGSIY
jgi:predicted outer membrane repeat protein